VVSFLMLTVAAGSLAQNSNQDPTIADLQRQIQEMRSQMAKMQKRIAELEAPNGTAETNSTTDPIQPQSQTPPAEALRLQLGEVKTSKEATPFNYKGITLTPGGFLESTILVRTRNENADMANSWARIAVLLTSILSILYLPLRWRQEDIPGHVISAAWGLLGIFFLYWLSTSSVREFFKRRPAATIERS
jgi:uncharacterized coiled-coil protein SlyX